MSVYGSILGTLCRKHCCKALATLERVNGVLSSCMKRGQMPSFVSEGQARTGQQTSCIAETFSDAAVPVCYNA